MAAPEQQGPLTREQIKANIRRLQAVAANPASSPFEVAMSLLFVDMLFALARDMKAEQNGQG